MSNPVPTRTILAANLNILMQVTPALESNPKLGRRSGLGIATIARIRNADVDATIDSVTKLADAFGLSPWQLLVPNLCPANPPVLRQMSQAEAELFERLRSVIRARDDNQPV